MGKIFDRIHEKVTRKVRKRKLAREHNKALEKIAKEEEREAYDEAYIRERRKVGRKKAVKNAQAGRWGSLGPLVSVGSFGMSHPMDTEKVGRTMGGSSAFDLGFRAGGSRRKDENSHRHQSKRKRRRNQDSNRERPLGALEKELGL